MFIEKTMLVVDRQEDEDFLRAALTELGYKLISLPKGSHLGSELIHLPDLVFISALGKHQGTLRALWRIKRKHGKPKLVLVKPEEENAFLIPEQKDLIDAVLLSPLNQSRLTTLLTSLTGAARNDLRNPLLYEASRKQKYEDWTQKMKKDLKPGRNIIPLEALKEKQTQLQEDPKVKKNRQHFLKTLFKMNP